MPTIGAPLQGYYYDLASDKLLPLAGTFGPPGGTQYGLTLVGDATANVTLTAMAAAEDYFNGTPRYCTKVDLLGYTQCRLVVRKMATAGAAASKIMLKYSATNPANAFSGAAWTASGAEVALNTTNVTQDSGWVNMPAGMCVNDIFITATQSGGDGSAGPVTGGVWVYFRNPGIVIPQADFRGIVGYAEQTTPQTGIAGSLVDMTGLSIPFTAVTGRRYKITFSGVAQQLTGAATPQVIVTDVSNTQLTAAAITLAINAYGTFAGSVVKTFPAGSTTIKLRASTGGGGTLSTAVAATQPFTLLVEDIG